MAEKTERKVSPIGEAKWAHVHDPKPAYKDPKTGMTVGKPGYQIDIIFEKGGEWDSLIRKITSESKVKGYNQNPIKKELDDTDQPTGRGYITFKTGEKYPPKVFDKFGRLIPEAVLIGNGSKVRVAYKESEYQVGQNSGFKLYLNAVQVLELVEYVGGTANDYGFDVEEGAEPFPEYQDTGKVEILEDEIPF